MGASNGELLKKGWSNLREQPPRPPHVNCRPGEAAAAELPPAARRINRSRGRWMEWIARRVDGDAEIPVYVRTDTYSTGPRGQDRFPLRSPLAWGWSR